MQNTISALAPDVRDMAEAIVRQHRPAFADPLLPAQDAPPARSPDPVYQAALHACAALGFIAADAHVLAHAWQARSARLGSFDATHWPDAPGDFGLAAPDAHAAFAPCPHYLHLYGVLPDARWIGRMARAGVPTLQLRFKSTDRAAIAREVAAAVAAVAGTGARLFINDHWREAVDAGAYGVHLGQEDLAALRAAEIDTLRRSGLRLGLSTHGYAEMLRACAVRPSYIALGAIFPTTLKKMPTAPQGLARLVAYVRLLRQYPLVAIGGISPERIPAVCATGVGGVAVVRALLDAPEPEAAARHLLQRIRAHQTPPFAE